MKYKIEIDVDCILKGGIDSEKAKTILESEANILCRYFENEDCAECDKEDRWSMAINSITVNVKEVQ
jgi:hypothetical protein